MVHEIGHALDLAVLRRTGSATAAAQPAFQAAVIRGGAAPVSGRGFPTTYPDPASFWQEYFSEAFMLYQSSPDLLQRNRPNVHAFLLAKFP